MQYTSCKTSLFIEVLGKAQASTACIRQATTPVQALSLQNQTFYLSSDNKSGYAINIGSDLTSVFSTVKGRGTELVQSAIKDGAKHLDCFDGFLVTFYTRLGFIETDRVPNWTDGQPDVVFMSLNN